MLGFPGSLRIEAAEETDQVNAHLRQHLLLHHHHHLHPHCQLSSQGKYECVATNTVGTEYSYSAQLYVRGSSYHYCYRHRRDYLCQSSLLALTT